MQMSELTNNDNCTIFRRGDIYYIINTQTDERGDPKPGRPAIIVSNDHTNAGSDCVEIVYLTTQPKRPMPTHVTLESKPDTLSIALCESVFTIRKDRLGQFMRPCSAEEMQRVNAALAVSLGLPVASRQPEEGNAAALKADLDFYRRMVGELLSRLQKNETRTVSIV